MATDLPDPADVHPEHDVLTPDNADDWSDDQIETYKAAKEADLAEQATENTAEMAKEERETLDALRSTTESADELTTTVNLGDAFDGADDVEIEVTTKVTGELEAKFDAISEETDKDVPRIANIKEEIIDAILLLIVDDPEPETDQYRWGSRAVWEAFYMEEGSGGLMQVFQTISEPAMDRYEELGNSQSRTRR